MYVNKLGPDHSKQYISKKIDENSINTDIYNNKGIDLCLEEKFLEGINYFDKVIKAFPLDYIAILNKGTALTELKEFDRALKCFETCITIESRNHLGYNCKGVVFMHLKDYKRAIVCFNLSPLFSKHSITNQPLIFISITLMNHIKFYLKSNAKKNHL